MEGWLNTFYRGALDALPEDLRKTAVDETVALLAPALRAHDGHWTADYVRLRFMRRLMSTAGHSSCRNDAISRVPDSLVRLQQLGPEQQPGNDAAHARKHQKEPQAVVSAWPPTNSAGPRLRAGFTLTPVM